MIHKCRGKKAMDYIAEFSSAILEARRQQDDISNVLTGLKKLGVVMHACNPSYVDAEVGVQEQLGQQSKTLPQKNKKHKNC
jgi:hypothetical protein